MYFKYTPYLYLLAAAFFIFDAVMRYLDNETYYLSLGLAAAAIFMFFFRRNMYKRFNDRNSNK